MDNLGKYVYAEQKRQEGTGYMKQQTVYLKCDRSAEVQAQDVFLKDVAEIRCQDPVLQAKLKAIKIYHFPKDGKKRCVISCLKLVSLMEEICPEIDVQVVGETDVLVEWICVNRHKGWQQWIKAAFVCLISFFGTAYTIMAYHNDVGINEVFTEVYRMAMGAEPGGLNTLEVFYSLGLAAGIIVFFNHVGGRRLTKDPTPVETDVKEVLMNIDPNEVGIKTSLQTYADIILKEKYCLVNIEQTFNKDRMLKEMQAVKKSIPNGNMIYRYSRRVNGLGAIILDSINIIL